MFRKYFKKPWLVYSLTSILVLVSTVLYVPGAKASAITSNKDTLTTENTSATADHTVVFTLPAGVDFDSTTQIDILRVDFPTTSAFTTGGTWTTADFSFNDGTARTINAATPGAGTIDCTVAAGVNNVCIAIDTTNLIFTIKPSSTYTASATGATATFTILGTAGNGTLTNPSGANSYAVSNAMCDETASCTTSFTSSHTGAFALSIIANDQVTVSATVDPSITFTLSANSLNLGTLSTASVSSATMTVQTVTNAVGGFSTTVLENNNLRIDVSNDINDVADGTVTAGAEEYGMSTTDTGQTITNDADCATPFNALAITSSAQTTAGAASGPVNETNTLCFAASITSTTTAGAYSHILTFISTGTF